MKVVVAGGSGLLGSHLIVGLLGQGHRPVILSRDPERARAHLPADAQVVGWSPPELGAWTLELADAGAVIDLTGASVGRWPWTAGRMRLLRESRIEPTKTLIRALSDLPVERRPGVLLNASGTDLYEGRDAEPADESTQPADTFLSRLCIDWEEQARQAEALGLRVVLLRFSLVFAPGAPALNRLTLPFRMFVGGTIGSGSQWLSWVSVDDAVGIVLFALHDAGISGPLNIAAPDPRRQADFARCLGEAMHRPSRVQVPSWVVRLVLREQATLILGSRRVWPAKALAAGYAFQQPHLEEALRRAIQVA
ncbi:MAG: TIGR01777 family oxidoreductase [Candidatus Limnocylindrales bacterium]